MASKVMTAPLWGRASKPPQESVATLREIMRQRGIHHIPMVDDGRFAGVVDATSAFGWVSRDAVASDLVGRVEVQAHPDEQLFDVFGRCAWSPRDVCVVTLEESGSVVGIVTERDIVRLAATHIDSARPVDQFASTAVFTSPATATVGECLDVLREQMFRHLVIVEDDKLRGTVSLRDLLLVDARLLVGQTLPDPPPRASWNATLREIASTMQRLDLDAIALVDDDGVPDGIVTVTDLLRALRSTPKIVA